ncbi:MAG: hypothetical protein EXX96DRAFT_638753 [Benjaminiella poitrasii]|nr:MAG: hypothetical protein EXX96DRAFT_638753 [Benjaminiella poitrasii]
MAQSLIDRLISLLVIPPVPLTRSLEIIMSIIMKKGPTKRLPRTYVPLFIFITLLAMIDKNIKNNITEPTKRLSHTRAPAGSPIYPPSPLILNPLANIPNAIGLTFLPTENESRHGSELPAPATTPRRVPPPTVAALVPSSPPIGAWSGQAVERMACFQEAAKTTPRLTMAQLKPRLRLEFSILLKLATAEDKVRAAKEEHHRKELDDGEASRRRLTAGQNSQKFIPLSHNHGKLVQNSCLILTLYSKPSIPSMADTMNDDPLLANKARP